ncbi:CCDC22 (predicted), partial [Pycnogonum litorale]
TIEAMEEVDDIIIHSLRLIGCEIGDEVDSIKLFSTDLIVNATVSCLKLISPDNHGTNQLSAKLPSSMSGRFRLGSVLTDACKEIGYKGEIGYQTFLYANEVDIRRVFMFLIEKLPKDVEKSIDEPLGASTLLNRAISSELAKRLKLPWLPPVCSPSGVRNVANDEWHREGFKTCADFNCHQLVIPYGLEDLTQMPSKELISYFSNHVHPITRQLASPDALSSSVLERNAISSTADQEWENEWNLTGLSSRLSASDYRARKKQRIDKRIRDSLKRQLQSCEVGGNGTNAQHDLHQLLTSMSTNTTPVGNKFDDSRFAHSEKLQFTEDKNVDDQLPVLQNIGSSVADVEEE